MLATALVGFWLLTLIVGFIADCHNAKGIRLQEHQDGQVECEGRKEWVGYSLFEPTHISERHIQSE